MIHRAFRYRLKPTAAQAETLAQFVGTTRFIYNLALEQRRDFWRQYRAKAGGDLNFVSQGREVTELRAAVDWIRAAPSSALTQALRDLDKAFANFWSGRARYPTRREKGVHDSFRVNANDSAVRQLNSKWASVRIPNLGWIKFRRTRGIRGRPLSVTVASNAGAWFVSIACEIDHQATASALPSIGIDRGIANTLALSNGELLFTPCTAKLERRKKRAQRILARRVRGSARYRRQRARLSRITAKIGRVRADWRHKATTDIATRYGVVTLEALKVVNMTASGRGKRGLNRSILEQGWGAFERVLAYKLEDRGGALVKVNPAYSSQTCSDCGVVDSRSRESQARFVCTACGFTDHADTNAAKVILRRSTAPMRAEGAGYGPAETRTVNLAA